MEALRYPADYDGIIAGAPVNFRTHQLTWELWVSHAVHRDAASYIPPAKYPAIHQAALDACDARDGLRDGLIEEPATCRFDPKVLACTGADSPSCLTPPQVTRGAAHLLASGESMNQAGDRSHSTAVRIRKWRVTRVRAASMRPRISCAKCHEVRLKPDTTLSPAQAGHYGADGPAEAGHYGAEGPAEAGHYLRRVCSW